MNKTISLWLGLTKVAFALLLFYVNINYIVLLDDNVLYTLLIIATMFSGASGGMLIMQSVFNFDE